MQGPTSTADGLPRIGRYVVEEKLGEGGMAETWLALVDGVPDHYVVIKTMLPERRSDTYDAMFVDEARIGFRLKHRNIPRVIEFGHTPSGMPFMVQEFVDGPSVLQLIAGHRAVGPFDLRLAARITIDIANALNFAYHTVDERGRPLEVVHRDISPGNILVSKEGTTKLIDFGVARFTDRTTETQTGILKGKLPFMPPEAILQGAATHQGDLYALGIVLYRMCTGRMPTLVAAAGAYGGFEPPSKRRADIDPELERIMLCCVHTDRAQRYTTGEEIADDLLHWCEQHGGVMTDREVTRHLYTIFGDPDDDAPGATSMAPSLYDPEPTPGQPVYISPPAPPARTAPSAPAPRAPSLLSLAAFSGGLALALLAAGLIVLLVMQPLPSFRPVSLLPPDAHATMLLDQAEEALRIGDIAEARTYLEQARGLALTDVGVAARRTSVGARADLLRRIQQIEALALVDLDRALADARALQGEHPESAAVVKLLQVLTNREQRRAR